MRKPDKPFYFNTSENLLRIGRQKVSTLSELWQALQTRPHDSIFQHTFRTLEYERKAAAAAVPNSGACKNLPWYRAVRHIAPADHRRYGGEILLIF